MGDNHPEIVWRRDAAQQLHERLTDCPVSAGIDLAERDARGYAWAVCFLLDGHEYHAVIPERDRARIADLVGRAPLPPRRVHR